MKRTGKLALSGILVGLGVFALFAANLAAPLTVAFAAFAGLFCAVAVLHCGLSWALGVWVVTAAAALLLLPDKTAACWYLLFFGHYPVIKSLLERIKNQVICWAAKIAAFGVCTVALLLLFRALFLAALPDFPLWILLVGLLIGFVMYDIAFSALISFYVRRLANVVGPTVNNDHRR